MRPQGRQLADAPPSVAFTDNGTLAEMSRDPAYWWGAPWQRHAQQVTPLRILVADDDPEMRLLLAHALKKEGCEVVTVNDGAELLHYVGSSFLARNHFAPPDVIISDIRMPRFTGLQILAGLRDAKKDTPIILISALDDEKTTMTAFRLGAAAFFRKPFDTKQLCKTVRDLVS
jgi:DNA-binding response OmpR family regulator